MPDEEKVPAWADAFVKGMESRMDALEAKKADCAAAADSEELEAEEKKKVDEVLDKEAKKEAKEEKGDSEEKEEMKADESKEEEKKEKADAAKADKEMKAKIAELQAKIDNMTAPTSASDRDQLSIAQAKADAVAQMFGDTVNSPLYGETPIMYRKRLVAKFKGHSSAFKDASIDTLDGAAFDLVEKQIYNDAIEAAKVPENMPAGRLIPIVRNDGTGRQVTTYVGDIAGFIGCAPGMSVKINKNFHEAR